MYMITSILRDPVWQFAGAIIGAVAVAISIWAALRARRTKRLTYSHRFTPLLSVGQAIRDKVSILYDGQPVTDVQLLSVVLRNSGDMPIVPADFVRPIELSVAAESTILTADVSATEPNDLGAGIEWTRGSEAMADGASRTIVLQPLLLNPRDTVTLSLLVTGSSALEVRGRIAGVARIATAAPPLSRRASALSYAGGGLLGCLASAFGFIAMRGSQNSPSIFLLSFSIVAIVGVPFVYWIVRRLTESETLLR